MKQLYSTVFLLIVFVLFSVQSASAQSLKDRYFSGFGTSFFDTYNAPLSMTSDSTSTGSYGNVSLITVSYISRFNLVEFGKSTSISADAPIAVGGLGAGGLAFNIPLTLNLNIGNVSTYSTDANKGFTIGAGIEYVYLTGPFAEDNKYDFAEHNNSWFQPVANVGYRYWNKRNKATEINLKLGYGSSSLTPLKSYSSEPIEEVTAKTFSTRLAFVYYLNY